MLVAGNHKFEKGLIGSVLGIVRGGKVSVKWGDCLLIENTLGIQDYLKETKVILHKHIGLTQERKRVTIESHHLGAESAIQLGLARNGVVVKMEFRKEAVKKKLNLVLLKKINPRQKGNAWIEGWKRLWT